MLHFTQYYLDCLSQASYLVGDTESGQAVVIDPRRDVEDYLADAAAHGMRTVSYTHLDVYKRQVEGRAQILEATTGHRHLVEHDGGEDDPHDREKAEDRALGG